MAIELYHGVGKRKCAIARVWLRTGKGKIVVNKKELEEYFPRLALQEMVKSPLLITAMNEKFDVTANIVGGGVSGQAAALRHAISNTLLKIDAEFRKDLKKEGYLTRDARVKERRKYGLHKARKRPQYSKR